MGKTSILLRFTQGEFKSDTRNTVGVDLKVKMINFRGTKLKLTIWDTGRHTNRREEQRRRKRTEKAALELRAHGACWICLALLQLVRSASAR